MLLKIDTRGMSDEKFIKVIRLLSVYCTRGLLNGFDADKALDVIYLHYNMIKHPKAESLYKLSTALGVSVTIVTH